MSSVPYMYLLFHIHFSGISKLDVLRVFAVTVTAEAPPPSGGLCMYEYA
jgi:hypothetical protein